MGLNNTKLIQINFTNKRLDNPPELNINGHVTPYKNNSKYVGMILDAGLCWKKHAKNKNKKGKNELSVKYRQLHWLLVRNCRLSIYNKILLYKQIIKSVWFYFIQLWGCTRKTNMDSIHKFQNRVLRILQRTVVHPYQDLGIPAVTEDIKCFASKHVAKLLVLSNMKALQLLNTQNQIRRLKREKSLNLA